MRHPQVRLINFDNRQTPVAVVNILHVAISASDETKCFDARGAVAYATIVAEMSRHHEIGFVVAIGLAPRSNLGLSLRS
jgi:hypothetical protein